LEERFGTHADALVLALMLAAFALLHVYLQRHALPRLALRRSPPAYDEQRILLDLGHAARAATSIDELYKLIVRMIGDALNARNVSIFVRDDATGDFVCRMSTLHAEDVDAHDTRHGASSEASGSSQLLLRSAAFVVKRLRNLAIPLSIEPKDFETWMLALSSAEPAAREARERESATLRRIDARLLLQIKMKGQLVGILSLGGREGAREFSARDQQLLVSVASQLALVIENSKLVARLVEEERLRRELELAAEVQRRLFPTHAPASATLELSGFCRPARGVGGDYYDFLTFDLEQIGVAVADVAGKGISAALLMSIVQASLRSQAMTNCASVQTEGSIANLVSAMNRLLCRSTGDASYVTFFYAQFDERTRQLTYVNAGHNPPFLIRPQPVALRESAAAGACVKLTTGGPVIGLFESFFYEEEMIQLQSGDLLVAYTDGVTEALSPGGEEFGEERLRDLLTAAPHLSAEEMRDRVVRDVQTWSAGAPQHDDLTFVIFKLK
ncbi:MAG TPA: SpoIIE family protein phosphatase, partial [Pyrinomonadaceae bacterium]|nr:SpoIIE family protein phosphatase [Pyrinomonadaceae bacterium]